MNFFTNQQVQKVETLTMAIVAFSDTRKHNLKRTAKTKKPQ